jgi:hypothetical protein
MKKSLTQNDIKEIRYQCRMGYILPPMLFIFGTIFTGGIYALNFSSGESDNEILLFIAIVFAGLAFFIGYKMNWKYISDIKCNEKEIETKIIQRKESKRSYEAGSGTLYIGQEMKGNDLYSVIVENIRYRVDEELFSGCSEGDEVLCNYAPMSRYLINIELKKKPGYNKS